MESRSWLALALLALDELDPALAQVEQVLDHLTTRTLHGAREPARIYWNCYTVLRAHDDPRAPALLAEVFELVQSQAARIDDERLRHSFLHAAQPHPQIMREVESLGVPPRLSGAGQRAAVQSGELRT